jgi:hypothetical protein
MELWQHSATELAALVAGRQVSCREVARATSTASTPSTDSSTPHALANLCAKFGQSKNQTAVSKPVTSTFARSEGFEPPTF